jgi:rubrerythrin
MSMTREEAITQLDLLLEYCESMMTSEYPVWRRDCEALQMLIAALRPISREQVEKVWRGEWIGSGDGYADGELVYDTWTCSECGHVIDEEDDPDMLPQFCPKCYAAMTDEAVEMVMERMEAVYEQDND